jgi:hypothetical protein
MEILRKSQLEIWYETSSLENRILTVRFFIGPLVRLSLAGDEILVLNHPEDAEELVTLFPFYYKQRLRNEWILAAWKTVP